MLTFRLVDAFAEQPFGGNSAGVILDADGLSDEQMQLIAREVNASETSFIIGGNDLHQPPRLRWFTPTVEAGFCGHATLAAAQAWLDALGRDAIVKRAGGELTFQTRAGLLSLLPEFLPGRDHSPIWWLSMPDPKLRPEHINPMKTCEHLGLTLDDLVPTAAISRSRDDDVFILIKSWQRLNELRPNFQALADWSTRHKVRGFCIATLQTPADSIHVVSRFFAPAVGIPEDPVTGSAHGPLAALLVSSGLVPVIAGQAALTCVQGPPGGRTGLVRVLLNSTGSGPMLIRIGGSCHTIVRGEMHIPSTQK